MKILRMMLSWWTRVITHSAKLTEQERTKRQPQGKRGALCDHGVWMQSVIGYKTGRSGELADNWRGYACVGQGGQGKPRGLPLSLPGCLKLP